MNIEFDTTKDEINRDKHGVSLAFGAEMFRDPDFLVIPTFRIEDEEQRYKAIGMVDGRLWTVVHVNRGDAVRFISVRKSNGTEQKYYRGDSR